LKGGNHIKALAHSAGGMEAFVKEPK
jgi:hypothetical protein